MALIDVHADFSVIKDSLARIADGIWAYLENVHGIHPVPSEKAIKAAERDKDEIQYSSDEETMKDEILQQFPSLRESPPEEEN